jgi:hypothetical protein
MAYNSFASLPNASVSTVVLNPGFFNPTPVNLVSQVSVMLNLSAIPVNCSWPLAGAQINRN